MAAARTSFSNDSRLVKVPLPKSVLLKDYLIDDLSSCSSNGFRSYPRRPCCTKVRYLIEIDLNKHINLRPTKKKFLRSKSKSSSVLQKASAAVVNVFKHFQFSGSGKRAKANFLPKNLSRKLSNWKRTIDGRNKEFNKRLNPLDEPVKEKNKKKNVLRPPSKVSTAATTTSAEVNTSTSNSNNSASSDSYFTTTSVCSTTNSSSKINVAINNVVECEQHTTEKKNTANGMKSGVATAATDSDVITRNAKKDEESEKKEQCSPVSVMEFPCDDDEDEVTSPFQHSHLYAEGTKRKVMSKVQRVKSLVNYNKLKPVRLEDRIALSESTTTTPDLLLHDESSNQTRKKATALLQQFKATMSSSNQFESIMTQNVLLGFFIERIMEGSSASNFALLQEAKNWINGDGYAREITFEYLVREMDKEKIKWDKYDDEVEKRQVCLVLECQVFTSLVEEMLLEFYM
ncbi:unnamed protein product [Lactuca saligna]|uniref:DUF4378 domain-containing protein n=1 Tax=Lactuca saligna TaxID=75948 RepID=A0AA36DWV6_LACSI|nr:unnamed protein product [Lactuca saligna]